jgi:ubiquinone/menaquinone biosynthesis C-methylase UbiE
MSAISADERIDVHTNLDKFQNHLHWQRYNLTLDVIDPKSSVLELGTGLGVFSEMLIKRVSSYQGIEYDLDACHLAQQRVGSTKFIVQGDAQNLKYDNNSFDEVLLLEVLEHLPDYRKALTETVRVLRPGGKLHVSIPYRRIGGPSKTNPHHLYEPGEKEFLSELSMRFSEINVLYQRFEETALMGLARRFRVRRFFGLVKPYRQLTEGNAHSLQKIHLDEKRDGMLLGVFCTCTL